MSDHPFRPVLRTQADVELMWRRLMSPLGFSSFSLWVVVIEDDLPVPSVMEFVDTPESPGGDDVEALALFLGELAAPGTRFAFLRSRPGTGRPSAGDRAWALMLYEAGRRSSAVLDVIHLAHDHDVYPLTADDLLAEPA